MISKPLISRLAGLILVLTVLTLTASPLASQEVGVEVPLERPKPLEATPPADLEPEAGALHLSLTEALAMALERNLDLRVSRNAYRDAILGVEGARAIFDLGLSAGLSTSENTSPTISELEGAPVLTTESRQGSLGLTQQTPLGGALSLSWNAGRSASNSEFALLNPSYSSGLTFGYTQPLSQGFGRTVTRSEILVAQWSQDVGRADLEGQIIATVQQVANAYWDLVEAWQQLEVAEDALTLAEELHEQNQIRVEVGTLPPLELVQSEAGVANQRLGILRARAAVGNAADQLRLLLDLEQGHLWAAELVPETQPTPQPLALDLEEALAVARRQRVELAASQAGLEQARLQQSVARSQARPRVDLDLSYTVNGVGGDIIDPDTGGVAVAGGLDDALDQIADADFDGWQVGVQVAYPLQNRGARVQRARAEIATDNSETRHRSLQQQIATEVRTAARNLESAWQQVEAARASSRLAQESLEAEQTRFEEGMSTSFLVLQAQNELTAARSQEVSATVGYDRAVIDYHRAIGNLLETTGIRLAGDGGTSRVAVPVASPRSSLLSERTSEEPVVEPGSHKVTYEAPANLALVKHWGMRDEEQALPCAPSLSMTLTACVSITTVQYRAHAGRDEVLLAAEDGRLEPAEASLAAPVRRHLDRLRAWAGAGGCSGTPSEGRAGGHFRVATRNSFPSRSGSAFSASGFAALTLATVAALGREASPEELSLLARASGRGSAARSVLGGWVVWPSPSNAPHGPAKQLFPPEHWDLRDVIAVVEEDAKGVSPLEGHRRARSSVLFPSRLGALPARLAAVERAIAARDLARLGGLVEAAAAELQAIALSSEPPAVYPAAGTLAVLRCVTSLRERGVPVYWSLDAGANVHLLCEPDHERAVADSVAARPEVIGILHDCVGKGPRRLEEHLF